MTDEKYETKKRKSKAYHLARTKAKQEGLSEEATKQRAREAWAATA